MGADWKSKGGDYEHRVNWTGWELIMRVANGMDPTIGRITDMNDGDRGQLIRPELCTALANAIDRHIEWISQARDFFRNAAKDGGFWQW